MKNPTRRLFAILTLFAITLGAYAQYIVESPDKAISVTINQDTYKKGNSKFMVPFRRSMTVVFESNYVLKDKELSFEVKSGGHRYTFGKSITSQVKRETNQVDESNGILQDLRGRFNTLSIETKSGITLDVRVYNNGVAYRYRVSGYEKDFKILDVSNVFPTDKPMAIRNTYTGDYDMPWRTMEVKHNEYAVMSPAVEDDAYSDIKEDKFAKLISWRNALTTMTVGAAANWFNGDTWRDMSQDHSFGIDVTYKYLYTGLAFTYCQEMMYINWQEDYHPFEGVRGTIHAWRLTGKLGFSLPVQFGYNIWNFTPYVAGSYLPLIQHRKRLNGFEPMDTRHHALIGPGFKLQCTVRGRIVFGINYEYQFFTGKDVPVGMNSLGLSLGYQF